jgi:hypothetical protein
VFFRGACTDPDEDYGDELEFIWYSDRSGELGTERSLNSIILPAGSHTITLEVWDTQGGMSTASVTINVTAEDREAEEPETDGDRGSDIYFGDPTPPPGPPVSDVPPWLANPVILSGSAATVLLFAMMVVWIGRLFRSRKPVNEGGVREPELLEAEVEGTDEWVLPDPGGPLVHDMNEGDLFADGKASRVTLGTVVYWLDD